MLNKNSQKAYSKVRLFGWIFFTIFFIGLGFSAPFVYKIYKMYQSSVSSRIYMEDGIRAFERRDMDEMFRSFALAKESFGGVYKEFQIFKQIKPLYYSELMASNVKAIDTILEVSNILLNDLSYADSITSSLVGEFTGHDFFDSKNSDKFRRLFYSRYDELGGVIDRLNLANLSLWSINTHELLPDIKKIIDTMRSKVDLALNKSVDIRSALDGGLAVLGLSSSREYLVLLLNDTELRPGGGFIGSYARVSLVDGGVASFIVDDVYNLDRNAPKNYHREPPEPIRKYLNVNDWFLRDSNWSPDFQKSARLAIEMYGADVPNQPALDGVIAVTTGFVGELMDVIGGVKVDGITYDSNNFVDILEYKVEREYSKKGVAEEDRKKILGTLANGMIERLKNLSFADKILIARVFKDSIEKKDVQLYHENIIVRSLIKSFHADGAVKPCVKDCVSVVDANLAGLKTDPVMDKRVYYTIEKNDNGKMIGSVEFGYRHTGSFDWKTTRYNVYTRLFVPCGSHLLSVTGVDPGSVVEEIDSDRSVFGWYWSIEPGAHKKILIRYELPFSYDSLIKEGVYDLFIGKQAGNNIRFFIDAQEMPMIQSINDNTKAIPLGKWFLLEFDRSGSYPLQE